MSRGSLKEGECWKSFDSWSTEWLDFEEPEFWDLVMVCRLGRHGQNRPVSKNLGWHNFFMWNPIFRTKISDGTPFLYVGHIF